MFRNVAEVRAGEASSPRHADMTPGRAANGARTRAVPAARRGGRAGRDRARVFRPYCV